jgi:magnesium-transporting ATPase (P-type)
MIYFGYTLLTGIGLFSFYLSLMLVATYGGYAHSSQHWLLQILKSIPFAIICLPLGFIFTLIVIFSFLSLKLNKNRRIYEER